MTRSTTGSYRLKDRTLSSTTRLLLALMYLTHGCQRHRASEIARLVAGDAGFTEADAVLPARGADSTLDIASWNLDWFGDISNGPADDALQLQNAHAVIAGVDMDIWGFAEIVSVTQWSALKSRLPDYTGLLASEVPSVGAAPSYENAEQKVGILYKTAVAALDDARLILTERSSDFAGRPPLQATFRVTLNTITERVVVIVMHAKCCADSTSWQQRVNASSALKTYLDGTFPTQKVWVIGDFNDGIDESITSGHPSPYANFAADTANYAFATQALSDARIASTVDHEEVIDHHLATNEAAATQVPGSAEVYRVDHSISNYETTTSDHYPVLSRFRWDMSTGSEGSSANDAGNTGIVYDHSGGLNVIINEIGANELGTDTAAEFVELVNLGSRPQDIAGWSLSDAATMRHTFAEGSSLAPGKAVVVFGGAAAMAGLDNAVAASSGKLSLANTGDSVSLCNASGTVVDSYSYSSQTEADGVSINRTPDGNRNRAFVQHTFLSTLSQSPGKRVDGTEW